MKLFSFRLLPVKFSGCSLFGSALKTEQCRQGFRPCDVFQMPRQSLADAAQQFLPRKEVIQPHLPIRLPCYDFTPVIAPALDGLPASGVSGFRGVTGGVYKARERIHRGMLIRDY